MIITNGRVITSTKQPEDLEDLKEFIRNLNIGDDWEVVSAAILEDELAIPTGKDEEMISAYLIPGTVLVGTILKAGAELRSFDGIDIITKPGTTFVNAQYKFTKEELASLAGQMAEKIQEMAQLEDDKKDVMSQFKAKIDECNAITRRLANNHANGYEYRDLEVETTIDFKAKKKYHKSIESGAIVKEEALFPQDYQLVFNF